MRSKLLLCLVPAAVLLTACHSQGGYMSADPALTYGPGVVEFPDPERVYLNEYRRAAAHAPAAGYVVVGSTAHTVVAPPAPVVHYTPPAPVVHYTPPAPVVHYAPPAPVVRYERPAPTRRIVRQVRPVTVQATSSTTTHVRAAPQVRVQNVQPSVRVHAEPVIAPVEPMPRHVIPHAGAGASSPPFPGAPLPAPTRSRGFTEVEIVR